MGILRSYAHLVRYREIARVAARYGFGFLADLVGQAAGFAFPRQRLEPARPGVYRLSRWGRVRCALEELGPTFVKIGQILSTRPDIVPPALAAELEKLQDQATPFSFSKVESVVASELGAVPDEVFSTFDPEPIAAASLGQVHTARLRTGEEVVVKVQRPGVERVVRTDIEILREVASVATRRSRLGRVYDLVEIVDELAATLFQELDYTAEAANADRLARALSTDPRIVIPRLYWEYTTRRVLTMERIHGTRLTELGAAKHAAKPGADTEAAEAAGPPEAARTGPKTAGAPRRAGEPQLDTRAISRALANTILEQILVHGVFHADLHPGNVVALPDARIALLDFGMVGVVPDDLKEQFGGFLLAVAARSPARLVAVLLKLGLAPAGVDTGSLTRDVDALLRRYYGVPVSQLSVAELTKDVLDVCARHHIRVRRDFALVLKALTAVEGTVRYIDPSFNLVEAAEPFAKRLVRERMKPASVLKTLGKAGADYAEFLAHLPTRLDRVLDLAASGQLKVKWELEGARRVFKELTLLVNRLALSVVLASIIVSTALIAQSAPAVLIWRFPLAEASFVLALVFGVWLVVSILRSRRF
ncbi:MAG TPA: AarF/ABC1/UbiB kinase family protein [Firmicutes bacterium]|nr:AarF/ABC1/UbiB kinase family protein [Bacillota bacterium]